VQDVATRLPGDFWRVCVAAVVSHLGSGTSGTASALLAASLTRDPRAVALVAVCSGLPWLLFALHTGALADRWDRKRAMWLCDLASAAQFALLALTVVSGRANLLVLCAVAFGTATVSTLFDSASQAALPSLVPVPSLDRANSRFYSGTVLTGLLLGPPLGSWAFGMAPALPFGLDAISFLGSAALILGVRTRIRATDEDRDTTGITRQIVVGLRWLWQHRQLRALVLLLTLWNLAETATIAVLVLYVLEVLHVPASFFGLLLSGLAVGGLAGSAAAPWLRRLLGLGGVIAGTVLLSVVAVDRRPAARPHRVRRVRVQRRLGVVPGRGGARPPPRPGLQRLPLRHLGRHADRGSARRCGDRCVRAAGGVRGDRGGARRGRRPHPALADQRPPGRPEHLMLRTSSPAPARPRAPVGDRSRRRWWRGSAGRRPPGSR
jgi:MFS family permease